MGYACPFIYITTVRCDTHSGQFFPTIGADSSKISICLIDIEVKLDGNEAVVFRISSGTGEPSFDLQGIYVKAESKGRGLTLHDGTRISMAEAMKKAGEVWEDADVAAITK